MTHRSSATMSPLLLLAWGVACWVAGAHATASGHKPPHMPRPPVRKIALEEHVAFSDMWPLFNNGNTPPSEWTEPIQRALTDLQDGRLAERVAAMDGAGIAVMVLSMAGSTQSLKDTATAPASIRSFNERIADGVAKFPKRFKWFCTLPMYNASAAMAELEWCMAQPSCTGALINGYATDGSTPTGPNYFDSAAYDAFWAKAVQLDAKLYFHPRAAEDREFFRGFPEMRAAPWGFSLETGEHMLRLMLSGLFDRHPGLKFIIGHNGEMLPYWADRIDRRLAAAGWSKDGDNPNIVTKLTVTEVLRRNFYITTSGMFTTAGQKHLIDFMGPERVMFSLDYPFEDGVEAAAFFDRAMVGMPRTDVEKVAYGNAAKLMRIQMP